MVSHFQIKPPPDIHTEYSDSRVPLCEDYLYCDLDLSAYRWITPLRFMHRLKPGFQLHSFSKLMVGIHRDRHIGQ